MTRLADDGKRGFSVTLWVLAIAVLIPPLIMIASLVFDGFAAINIEFLTADVQDAGRSGGIYPIIVSTFAILAVCLAAVIPLGLGCALYLSECVPVNSMRARWLGASLDMLSGVPSIVFGLFGYALFAIHLNLGFSILAGGLSLACMVLPLFVRISEQALRSCPKHFRDGAAALSISHGRFITKILLPNSARGLAAAFIISCGRALAETAVLIFTAGYVTRGPDSVLDSGRAMSVHIYDLAMNVPGGSENAAATAIVLITLIIIINSGAHSLARRLNQYA